ncbi:TrbC/VirB2 family protein [Comamonas thiooxydans]|uniref:hypothetical protein n=1 Tax=Comamonas TaxID=283 RepID=UPI000B35A2ED|nr:TrbC/VirB2 family protein [Comamonas thiooxydans]
MARRQACSSLQQLSITVTLVALILALPTHNAEAGGRKGSKSQSNKVKIQNIRSSSDESAAERDRRLYRECKGRPNSGACAGYTNKR